MAAEGRDHDQLLILPSIPPRNPGMLAALLTAVVICVVFCGKDAKRKLDARCCNRSASFLAKLALRSSLMDTK